MIRWTPEALALLGTLPDREVAARLGCSPNTVFHKRRSLGLAPARSGNWDPARDALLGTVPDAVLAAEWGASPGSVCQRRNRLRIPPYCGSGRYPRPPRDPALLADLAALADREVAAKYGFSRQRAAQLRQATGIPAPPHKKKHKRPGDTHGTAAVLGFTPAGSYRLRCKCGTEYEADTLTGGTKTCGTCPPGLHRNRRDITGPVPGSRLTATRRVAEASNLLWYFDCACGTRDFVARKSNVLNGLTKSCGCLRGEYMEAVRGHGFGWGPAGPPEAA